MTMEYREKFLTRRWFMRALAVGIGVVACGLPYVQGQENEFVLTHGPFLQVPGANEITVTWHTNRVGASKVLYGAGDTPDQSAVTSKAGLIPNDSTCHAVRLTGLTPGATYRYQAVTREFKGYVTPYVVNHGATVESDVYTFTTLDPGKPTFSFVMWNDIHDDSRRLEAMFNDVSWLVLRSRSRAFHRARLGRGQTG